MTEKNREIYEKNQRSQYPDRCRELQEIVQGNLSPKALEERISDYHENDIADALEKINAAQRAKIYRVLDTETLADIMEYARTPSVYLDELSLRRRVDVLARMETTDAVSYLEKQDKNNRSAMMELLPDDVRQNLMMMISFDEDEVGSVMSTNYIEIMWELTAKQALRSVIEQAAEHDNISVIYAADEDHTFYGALELKDLILSRPDTPIADLAATSYPYLYAREQVDECVERLKSYSEDSVPVLDEENRLIGVITATDLISVVDEEMGEDYAKFAGLAAEEELREPVGCSVRRRLPWLLILLALGMVVSSVVGLFEKVVAQLTFIVFFQSLVLDMAGNVGTQSLAVTIRVLMDEHLSGKDRRRLMLKESGTGLVNGLIMGVSSFILTGCYLWVFKRQPAAMAFTMSACIGAALVLSMFFASLVGTSVPMLFKRIHVDPAIASGPLITTLNDLVSVMAYYGFAWLFLIRLA